MCRDAPALGFSLSTLHPTVKGILSSARQDLLCYESLWVFSLPGVLHKMNQHRVSLLVRVRVRYQLSAVLHSSLRIILMCFGRFRRAVTNASPAMFALHSSSPQIETVGDCYIVAGGLMHKDGDGYTSVREDKDPMHAVHVFEFAKVR